MNNTLSGLSSAQLRRATAIKERIETLEQELNSLLGVSEAPTDGPVVRRRRKMSAEAREKIAAAQRARWAKAKAGKK